MEHETRSDSPTTNSNRPEHNSKTSFLIEDILYRGDNRFKVPNVERRLDYEPRPYFSVAGDVRPHQTREGYLQVAMGALGAYLHTPNTYKAVEPPYFLSQGKFCYRIGFPAYIHNTTILPIFTAKQFY